VIAPCADCGVSIRIHAKGFCKRCYLRAYNMTPARKAHRQAYNARNLERVRESRRIYKRKHRSQQREARELSIGYAQAVVRVPVKGWGCIA
jgi:hypothetical protein